MEHETHYLILVLSKQETSTKSPICTKLYLFSNPLTYNTLLFNIIQVHRVPCTLEQEMRYWSDMRCNNMNWSAISGNQLWGSGTNIKEHRHNHAYKLGALQESALPYLLYSLPYSPIAASLIQDECHLPVISCCTEFSYQIIHEPSQNFPLLPPTFTPQQEMLVIVCLFHCALPLSLPNINTHTYIDI